MNHILIEVCSLLSSNSVANLDSLDEGIVEVRDDIYRRYTGELRGKEELCAIGDEPLDEAGEGIEYRGSLAWVEAVLLGDLSGDLACGEDSDGVIGSAEVSYGDQGGDGEFSTTLTTDPSGEVTQEVIDPPIEADQLQHPPC